MSIRLFTIYILIIFLAACSDRHSEAWGRMDSAEGLMESQPDSALEILSTIADNQLTGREERARHSLLLSAALDKNYIDTTTFDVLQPAIDYYLKNGSPDQKLATYYYQGRIYQNAGDRDNALKSFTNGIDISASCDDSLVIARTLVAQACIYKDLYDIESYTKNNLKAYTIFTSIHSPHKLYCLENALNGALLLNDRNLADSLYHLCALFEPADDAEVRNLNGYRLSYMMKFAHKTELESFINKNIDLLDGDPNTMLNLANAYNQLGENEKAKQMLEAVDGSGKDYDTLKHTAISVSVFKDEGDYEKALYAYWNFNHISDSIDMRVFDMRARSIGEKHKIELMAQKQAMRNSKILWTSTACIIALVLLIALLILVARINKSKKELAIQKVKYQEAENAKLRSEKEMLQLEKDKKTLETENLRHRIEILENDSLKALLESRDELPAEIQSIIKDRMAALNSLLASHITANDKYRIPYDAWVESVTADTQKFMDSNRCAFLASHPQFIHYFEEREVSPPMKSIMYACMPSACTEKKWATT